MSHKKPKELYGLSRRHTKKSARDFVDFDYTESLTDEQKLWLDKFSREFYHARLLNDDVNLHDSPEARRLCYSANNQRNRDIWSKSARISSSPPDSSPSKLDSLEDTLIAALDEENDE